MDCLNKGVKRVKECKYCCECIHYKKCASNALERMKCKSEDGSCCGFLAVCCEDFVSRKSIDDIYEEQKRTEQPYEPENDSDYRDILEDDELPF